MRPCCCRSSPHPWGLSQIQRGYVLGQFAEIAALCGIEVRSPRDVAQCLRRDGTSAAATLNRINIAHAVTRHVTCADLKPPRRSGRRFRSALPRATPTSPATTRPTMCNTPIVLTLGPTPQRASACTARSQHGLGPPARRLAIRAGCLYGGPASCARALWASCCSRVLGRGLRRGLGAHSRRRAHRAQHAGRKVRRGGARPTSCRERGLVFAISAAVACAAVARVGLRSGADDPGGPRGR